MLKARFTQYKNIALCKTFEGGRTAKDVCRVARIYNY